MKKTLLLIHFLSLVIALSLLSSCTTRGPSESKAFQDYLSQVDKYCLDCVKLTSVKIIRTSIEGNSAEVVVQVTVDWISNFDPLFPLGNPCVGFNMSKGKSQTVEKKMIYKKYDSGWNLERISEMYLK